jgi:hypothetical protein
MVICIVLGNFTNYVVIYTCPGPDEDLPTASTPGAFQHVTCHRCTPHRQLIAEFWVGEHVYTVSRTCLYCMQGHPSRHSCTLEHHIQPASIHRINTAQVRKKSYSFFIIPDSCSTAFNSLAAVRASADFWHAAWLCAFLLLGRPMIKG